MPCGVGFSGNEAWYVFMLAGTVDVEVSQEKATAWRMMGRSGGGGVSASSIGGTTKSPSSDVGVKDRFCFCFVASDVSQSSYVTHTIALTGCGEDSLLLLDSSELM